MPIATGTALCFIKYLNDLKHSLFMTRNDHLGNTLTIIYDKILLRQIDEHHTYLTTIVSIHRPRGIQHRNTLFQGQSTTRANLCLKAFRQRNIQSCRNEPALHRLQDYWSLQISPQIHPRALHSGILRQRLMSFVDNLDLEHTFKITF